MKSQMYLDKNGNPAKASPNLKTFFDNDPTAVCFTEDDGSQAWWNVKIMAKQERHLGFVLERRDNSMVQMAYSIDIETPKNTEGVKDEQVETKTELPRQAKPAARKKTAGKRKAKHK